MRIACIALSRVPSRTANSIRVMKFSQALIRRGHEVRLIIPSTEGPAPWSELARHYGLERRVPIARLGRLRLLRGYDFSLRAVMEARSWGADLLYSWPLQAAAFASTLGMATLLELHNRPPGFMGPWLFRSFLRGPGALRVVTISDGLRKWILSAYPRLLQSDRVLVAPLGVDLRAYRQLPSKDEARKELNLEDGFVASYTGHLYRGRGLNLMVQLAQANPDVRFFWVGGEAGHVESWRADLQGMDVTNLSLVGFVPQSQVPLWHAASDVLLMPYQPGLRTSSGSRTEDFTSPLKLFEYLAAGRPILSSDLPVLREILSPDNAILLPPDDLEAWNRALRRLADDPGMALRLAQKARKDAEKYSWEARAERVLAGLP